MRRAVQQTVEAVFNSIKPDGVVSHSSLLRAAFPDIHQHANKHRASLSRAIKVVTQRGGWVRVPFGGDIFYCRRGSRGWFAPPAR
jgi:hypothetical protein